MLVVPNKMKTLIYILLILFLTSCVNVENEDIKNETVQFSKSLDSNIIGFWVMSNYFDSILEHKTIAKYRMQKPTWTAIILNIEDSLIYSYGSIMCQDYGINYNSDTISILDKGITGKWWLKYNKQNDCLELKQLETENYNLDTVVYIYHKRPKQVYFIDSIENSFQLGDSLTKYFNKTLLAGKYLYGSDTITFNIDGTITNWTKYNTYKIDNYFGTCHKIDNKDNIKFTRPNGYDVWSFEFQNNNLFLNRYRMRTGKEQKRDDTEQWIKTKDIITLKILSTTYK